MMATRAPASSPRPMSPEATASTSSENSRAVIVRHTSPISCLRAMSGRFAERETRSRSRAGTVVFSSMRTRVGACHSRAPPPAGVTGEGESGGFVMAALCPDGADVVPDRLRTTGRAPAAGGGRGDG